MENIKNKLKRLWRDERPFKKRLIISGAAALAFCFTFIFFGPLEMVAFGSDSFLYSYKDILLPIALTAAAAFVIGTLLLTLLKGMIFDFAVSAVFALTVCGYLQASFMNGSLGTLTGDIIRWDWYKDHLIADTLLWVVVILLVFFILYLNKRLWQSAVKLVSLMLIIMQFIPAAAILLGFYEQAKITDIMSYTLSREGMYELSSENNTIVIVLDRLDYDYIKKVMSEDPKFFDKLDGFTCYTNAISAYARTRPALAQLLTGYEETAFKTSPEKYYDDAWEAYGNNILTSLGEKGYTAELYTSIKYVFGSSEYASYVANAKYIENKKVIYPTLIEKLMNLSTYRYAPTAVKPFYWSDTNYYNSGIFANDEDTYVFNDSEYGTGVSGVTAVRENGSFKLYHLYGSHTPYTMNEDGTLSEEETTVTKQTMGCFNILYNMFDKMKELGIYKDATIIITGDHGTPIDDYAPLTKATRIGLFYKPSGSEGTPLAESKAQVCTDNIPATILKSIGASYDGHSKPLDEIGEEDEIERFYYKTTENRTTNRENVLYTYKVVGDAADFDNWEIIDVSDIDSGNGFN